MHLDQSNPFGYYRESVCFKGFCKFACTGASAAEPREVQHSGQRQRHWLQVQHHGQRPSPSADPRRQKLIRELQQRRHRCMKSGPPAVRGGDW